MSAYFFFVQDARPRLTQQGLKGPALLKASGVEWKELSPQQKAKFEAQAKDAKAKYEKEMAEYKAAK